MEDSKLATEVDNPNNAVTIESFINNQPFQCEIRTGTHLNIMSLSSLVNLNLLNLFQPNSSNVTLLNSTRLDFVGSATLDVSVGLQKCALEFQIVPFNMQRAVLGRSGLNLLFSNWPNMFQRQLREVAIEIEVNTFFYFMIRIQD